MIIRNYASGIREVFNTADNRSQTTVDSPLN